MRIFFYKIFSNLSEIFRGRNLLRHLAAITLTYFFVSTGFDWFYFELTQVPILQTFLFPSVLIGFFVPLFGILLFFLASVIGKKSRLIHAAYTLGQAALLGLLVSDFYKFFTGRPGPPGFLTQDLTTDISHIFRFGILRGGIFFGWPSTHTTIAFAMAFALIMLYPKNKRIRYAALGYAFYIGIGISATIHWFSDFAAGAIIGSVIGITVGRSFREQIPPNNDSEIN